MKKLIALVLALMLTFTLTACSGSGDATVLTTSGTVNIERDGETLSAESGTELRDGDVLRTAMSSRAWLQLGANRSVQMDENTELVLENRDAGYAWRTNSGRVTVRIDKPMAKREKFNMAFGDAVISVRGTSYTLTVLEQYKQKLTQLEKLSADVETMIAALQAVDSPVAGELLAKYMDMHIQPQDRIGMVESSIAMLLIEVHDGTAVITDKDGNEIEELTMGREMLIGFDDEMKMDKESIIAVDDQQSLIELIPQLADHLNNAATTLPSANDTAGANDVYALIPVIYNTEFGYDFVGIWECNIYFSETWTGPTTHTAADVTDVIVSVNGAPYPVPVVELRMLPSGGCIFKFVSGTTAEDIENAGFAQFPATYEITFKIHGVEVLKRNTTSIVVEADQTWRVDFPPDYPQWIIDLQNIPDMS